MIWIELLILLACIVIGARYGGLALGTIAGIGLAIFVFAFAMPPGGPPRAVIGMIIAVITALATMQAAGGLDYLVSLAGRILHKRPQLITFIAPVVTYALVFASGTTHVIYALLPVIAEVSRKADIRPERPLSISVIAGFQGVLASPISAVTVAMLGFLAGKDVSLPRLLAITIPSTFLAVLVGALSVAWRGAPLSQDAEYQRRLASGEVKPPEALPEFSGQQLFNARGSTLLFFAGILLVILIGMFPDLRPVYERVESGAVDHDQVSMDMAIMIVMFAGAGLMTILFKASPEATLKGTMMRSGVAAIISIVGVAWLGSSFFEANRQTIVDRDLRCHHRPTLGVRRRAVHSFQPALQRRGVGGDPDAGRPGPGDAALAAHRLLPGGQQRLPAADLRHAAGGGQFRSDRDDEDRQIPAEPQLPAAGPGHRGHGDRACFAAGESPSGLVQGRRRAGR